MSTAGLLVADCATLVTAPTSKPPSDAIPIGVENRDTGTTTVAVSFNKLPTEV